MCILARALYYAVPHLNFKSPPTFYGKTKLCLYEFVYTVFTAMTVVLTNFNISRMKLLWFSHNILELSVRAQSIKRPCAYSAHAHYIPEACVLYKIKISSPLAYKMLQCSPSRKNVGTRISCWYKSYYTFV